MLAHSASGPGTTRSGIERAALRLFVTRGLRGTTVRDIANRIAIYRRLGILPRRLAEYEDEVSAGLLGTLRPARRRRKSA